MRKHSKYERVGSREYFPTYVGFIAMISFIEILRHIYRIPIMFQSVSLIQGNINEGH